MAGSKQVDSGAGLIRKLFTGATDDVEPSSGRAISKSETMRKMTMVIFLQALWNIAADVRMWT